jgi:hypothetical protein
MTPVAMTRRRLGRAGTHGARRPSELEACADNCRAENARDEVASAQSVGGGCASAPAIRVCLQSAWRAHSSDMPNRGPLEVTVADCATLLDELPPPRDLKEAEDDEDRKRIKLHVTIRGRVEEQHAALSASTASDEKGALILSIDEVEEILDVLPPPPTLADVRKRLANLKLELQGA